MQGDHDFHLEFQRSSPIDSISKRIKILTPKQMLQRLPIAIAQVKASNTSDSLLDKIRQIVYSFYQAKEITKKVYNNINQNKYKMDTIFMKSENSKSSHPHTL